MATQRTSFNKLQRDRDKQEKAAAKRDRRQSRATATEEEQPLGAVARSPGTCRAPKSCSTRWRRSIVNSTTAMIDFETYEDKKTLLLSQLPVD
jgi:hypothetical protein